MKPVSRKAQRKQQRVEKRKRKDTFYRKAKGQVVAKPKVSKPAPQKTELKKSDTKFEREDDDFSDQSEEEQMPYEKSRYEKERESRLIREEERDIKRYEKLLKLKSYRKRNRLPKSFYLDGLGDLIELCDHKQYENRIETNDDVEIEPESDSDNQPEDDYCDEHSQNEEFDYEDQEMNEDDDEDFDEENSDEEEKNFDEQTKLNTKRNAVRQLNNDGHYEDIYGFFRDKDGEIVQKEESKRQKLELLESEVVVDENIQRKVRGLINRLTVDNIKAISGQIVELYKSNSRFMINKAIFNCIENMVIKSPHQVSCKIATEICLLIVILHSEVGDDIGGYFVHSFICEFDSAFKSKSELNNIIILILNLYATGLVDPRIIYDIIEMFCERFDEKAIEMIDLIIKSIGFLLRKDDASRMKSLIVRIQTLAASVDLSAAGSRIKFIFESLTAIKNNNVTKLKSSKTMVMTELIEESLKANLKKSRVPPLSGQYTEVIQSSSWFSFTKTFVPLEPINQKDKRASSKTIDILETQDIDLKLRDQLCRALRINTPLRKDLFTVLFQCNDYLDAACKLISIGKKQFSEVINLVLHVAINEKIYNQFYHHLLQHLSTCDRKYKLALDFAIRDKISQIESLKPLNVTNLEKLIYSLLKSNAISITCLKVVQFSDMNETYVSFIRNIFEPILSLDTSTVEAILGKISTKDNFASAIKLFITCFMGSEMKNKVSSIKQLQLKRKN